MKKVKAKPHKVVKLTVLQVKQNEIKDQQREKGILTVKLRNPDVEKLPDECYGREIMGRPVSPSIMDGDRYKLRN